MPIEFVCIECRRVLRAADGTAEKWAKCPGCGAVMQIPTPGTTAPGEPSLPGADPGGPVGPERPAGPESQSLPPSAGSQIDGQSDAGTSAQSPQPSGTSAGGPGMVSHAELHSYAAMRVSGPAIGLILTDVFGLVFQFVATIFNVLRIVRPDLAPDLPAVPELEMFSNELRAVFGFVGMILAILVMVAGIRMRRVQHYGTALTGAIIALVPRISPCCVLGLPFGIWAVVVLSDWRVHAAFASRLPE